MNNKIFALLFMSIFLVSLVSAETFKLNTTVDLKITCINNGYCSSSSVCNASVFAPDESTLLSGVQATRSTNGAFHNITLNTTQTTQIGEYCVSGFCKDGSVSEPIAFCFNITPSGFNLQTSDSLLYVIILIATFILFLGFLYPAITLPYSNEVNPDGSITRIVKLKYFKLLSIWFAYGFLMWFLQTLNNISINFIFLSNLSNFITNIFIYSQALSLGVTLLILSVLFIASWKDILLSFTIKKHGKAFLDGRLQ